MVTVDDWVGVLVNDGVGVPVTDKDAVSDGVPDDEEAPVVDAVDVKLDAGLPVTDDDNVDVGLPVMAGVELEAGLLDTAGVKLEAGLPEGETVIEGVLVAEGAATVPSSAVRSTTYGMVALPPQVNGRADVATTVRDWSIKVMVSPGKKLGL